MGEEKPQTQLFFQPPYKWAIAIGVLGSLAASVFAFNQLSATKQQSATESVPTPTTEPIRYVSALGRLEPEGEVIQLSASGSTQGMMSKVDQLLVETGDNVKPGQVIAILDNRDRLQAAVEKAAQQVQVAQASLAKVKAGAKTGELAAQQAEIARLEAQRLREIDAQQAEIAKAQAQLLREVDVNRATVARIKADLENAKLECQRYEQLLQAGAVTTSSRDTKCLAKNTALEQLNEAEANLKKTQETAAEQLKVLQATLNRIQETGREQINSARANLNRIAEVRPVDVQAANAEIRSAMASLKEAKANLETAYVKSPINGQVLKINTRAGETISNDGVVEIGSTGQMYVVAEVYETDINKIRLNQPAIITSKGFDWTLKGIVTQKALKVAKKDVLNTDPAADADARVVEVKIRINPEDSKKVADLTNLQVEVRIDMNVNS